MKLNLFCQNAQELWLARVVLYLNKITIKNVKTLQPVSPKSCRTVVVFTFSYSNFIQIFFCLVGVERVGD